MVVRFLKPFLSLILLVGNLVYAQEFLPAHLLQLDNSFTHHTLLVEKSTHTLFIYQNVAGVPKEVKRFKIASGKFKGDKQKEGDHKTPEGIYTLREFYSDKFLLNRHGDMAKMYGIGAFTTDYPNLMDQRIGKSGSGIWLHSTDDESRIDKGLDSRGCVVVNDTDLKDISMYLDLSKTPIVIVDEIQYRPKEAWEKSRSEILKVIDGWISAWQEKRFQDYISYYHPQDFKDRVRGNFNAFKSYKSSVFSRPDSPQIKFDSISVLRSEGYAVVTMKQDYRSAVINDIGKKTLYLTKDQNYDWKIVAELWERYSEDSEVAFTPKQRFFGLP
jgi:murein L,D-transpeptidase YafK